MILQWLCDPIDWKDSACPNSFRLAFVNTQQHTGLPPSLHSLFSHSVPSLFPPRSQDNIPDARKSGGRQQGGGEGGEENGLYTKETDQQQKRNKDQNSSIMIHTAQITSVQSNSRVQLNLLILVIFIYSSFHS